MKIFFNIPEFWPSSAGIVTCHAIANDLKKNNLEVVIVPLTQKEVDHAEGDIVVYPEIIKGNPLDFRNVVRLILNRPGNLGYGDGVFGREDYIVSASRIFYEKPDLFLRNYIFPDFFSMDESEDLTKRQLTIAYQGKGSSYNVDKHVMRPPFMMIPRGWLTQEDLAREFKRCRIFFSSDCMSW